MERQIDFLGPGICDACGKRREAPICGKCKKEKRPIIGKGSLTWICYECGQAVFDFAFKPKEPM